MDILLFQTFAFFLLFISISVIVFYIPGFLIIARSKKQLEDQEVITLSLSLGMVLFVIIAVFLALLNLRYLSLLIILLTSLLTIIKYQLDVFKPWKVFVKEKLLSILIILGIIVQGLINFPSGYLYKDGLLFWSSQGHDGLWHVALMEEIKKTIPPQNPIFAGENLYNYHYLVDVLMGEFYRIFPFFQSLDLYFRFFPVIFSLLIGISVFAFMSRWQKKQVGYLGIFFTYFVGSFGYIVTFLRNGNIFGGETIFWAAQQNTLLGNPPHAISHGLLVSFFLAFIIYLKERKTIWILVTFIIVSMLSGFKVSGGFVMLVGIVTAAVVDSINQKKFSALILALMLGLTNFITFKAMTSKGAASFLMFLPWWFVRTMVVDKLGWMDMELARQHYLSKGTWHAWLRVIQLESFAFMVFLLGNLGMRMLGFYMIIKNIVTRKFFKDPLETMLIATGLTGFLMVIFFVQKGIIYNNIQFMQYFLLIVGFYAAITVYNLIILFKERWVKSFLLILIVVFSVPTVIGNLNEFYGLDKTPLAKIGNQELEALSYLREKSNPQAIILSMPFNQYLKDKFPNQPRPIYAWYSTSYISAITGRRVYLASEEQALITGYPIDSRISKMKTFFEQSDTSWNRQFLSQEKINYIYVAKNETDKLLDVQKNNLEIFFENNEIIIYRVKS